MTNSLQVAKKAFSVAVAATTILWSVGLSAFLPTAASAAAYGDVIKGTTLKTVYYYGSDGQRYAFPNEKTYFSWYNDFSAVKTISDSELAAITLAGNIAYRPGSRWVKITSDAKVYAVSTSGKVRWIENEATAKGLGGDAWNTHIDDVPDVFFTSYSVGDSLSSPVSGYDGMLWSDGTSKFLVAGTKYQKITDAGFAANHYKAGAVLSGTGFTKSGLTAGTDISVAMANLTDAAQLVKTETYAVSQNVSVALSASSAASSTYLSGSSAAQAQALANLAAFDFTNPTSAPVAVKSLSLTRTGVSSDSTLSNVYLFNGYTRLSDSATVSSGKVSWNDASGLFTIPAGGKSTVWVRSDVAASKSGQTIGVKLNAASDVSFVGAFAAAGTFPIVGATHTLASVTDLGSVSFAATSTPSSDGAPDPQNDLKVWANTITVGQNATWLNVMRFRNTGSIGAADVKNFRLYVAGVMRGTAVAQQDANGYVTFDLSAAPVKLSTASHEVKVIADVIGGSTRTLTVGLRSAADAVFVDDQYQQPVLVQKASAAFATLDASAQTISAGSLSIVKRSDSPSGNIVNGASSAVLGRFDVKAAGEPLKVEFLNFNISGTNTVTEAENSGSTYVSMALRNGAVYLDGTQIGNTTAICSAANTTSYSTCTVATGSNDYTRFNFGSSFVVYPGTPMVLEVRGDIYDTNVGQDLDSTDTLQLAIESTDSTLNYLKKTSGSYATYPSADITAGTLTVKEGAMTVAKNSSYASQTAVAPKTAFKLGSFNVVASTTEDLNLTNLGVTWDTFGGAALVGALSNMYLEYGVAGAMTTTSTKATPVASNDWSLNSTLAVGKTMVVNVYADVASTVTDGGTDDTVSPKLIVSSTTAKSGVTVLQNTNGTAVTGQVSTWVAGTFASAKDGSSPVAFNTAANKTITAAKYRFTATSENYTIREVQLKVAATNAAGVIANVELFDGATPVGSAVFSGTTALITGMSVPVAANSFKILTAKLTLNNIGAGAALSQQAITLSLDSVMRADSQGVEATLGDDAAGSEIRAYKSVPTVSLVDLTNSTLSNGQPTDLYKFTVTADANGPIALKQFKLATTWSDNGTTDTMLVNTLRLYKNGSLVTPTTTVLIGDQSNQSALDTGLFTEADSALYVKFVTEDEIGAGETVTYTVRGTPQGFHVGTDSSTDAISFYLPGDTAHNAADATFIQTTSGLIKLVVQAGTGDEATNFIWSDMSGGTGGINGAFTSPSTAHSSAEFATGTGDWTNGYMVLNLDLGNETWSK